MTSIVTTINAPTLDKSLQEKPSAVSRNSKSTFGEYLARPGDGGILQTPLTTARAAWYGSTLPPRECITELTPAQATELTAALKEATLPDDLALVTLSDCHILPRFVHTDFLPKLKKELGAGVHGYGLHVVRGIPVQDWNRREQGLFFWMLGSLVGRPGSQDADGLLLQHVTDTGADPQTKRKYKTKDDIAFHCDGADVVGLLCLQTAQVGGASRVVSSVTVYNEFLQRYGTSRPEMVERLYQPFPLDVRSETGSYAPITPVRYSGNGQLRTFYVKDYFQSAYRHTVDPPTADGVMPALDAEVMKAYNDICEDPRNYLDMQFEPGDIQFLNNHVVLHARTAYETNQCDEQADSSEQPSQRHLLRLWLNMPEEQRQGEDWKQSLSRTVETVAIVVRFAWSKMRYHRAERKQMKQEAEQQNWMG